MIKSSCVCHANLNKLILNQRQCFGLPDYYCYYWSLMLIKSQIMQIWAQKTKRIPMLAMDWKYLQIQVRESLTLGLT